MKIQKIRRLFFCFLLLMLVTTMLTMPASAVDQTTPASGDIAGVVSGIWKDASGQVKTICNEVVFPAFSVCCGILFVVAGIIAIVNYKKHHTIEVGWVIALLVGLLVSLTAPTWVWTLVGM